MGFLDKARDAAQQATAMAQQGFDKGQAKFDEVQTSRAADGFLRDIGAAYYAEQRSGGSHEAVVASLGAMDAHAAANGPLDQSGSGSADAASQSPPQPSAPAGSPSAGPPAGSASAGPPAGSPSAGPPADPASAGPPASGGLSPEDL